MHSSWKSYGIIGFGKDSEQLTAVVDARVNITFMPHDDPEIS